MGAYSEQLASAVKELTPYIDSYHRDFSGDGCYAAFIEAVYMDASGAVVGVSHHCFAPTPEAAELFQDYTLRQTGSLLGSLVPDSDSPDDSIVVI